LIGASPNFSMSGKHSDDPEGLAISPMMAWNMLREGTKRNQME
jgi:hypothetical protein